jgi:orotidine-5'-phosphate decarboxylase
MADIRDRLAIALDTDDLVDALRIARQVQPYMRVAKVGLELYAGAGPEAIGALANLGFDVFLDVKLHDIPNTVNKAATVLGSLGARYLTLHAFGGADMLRAGVEGLATGAERAGLEPPTSLAVTVLTSDDGAPAHILSKRVQTALEGGCGGIVCAVGDAVEARHYGPRLTIVTPGIRPEGVDAHDQARAATPHAAFAAGSDLLVIGRAVTLAADPAKAAADLVASLS